MYYVYVYLDTRKKGSYSYGEFHFEYEPFYVGKGKNERYLTHLKIAKEKRRGKINLVVSKIRSIISDGFDPLILKLRENLSNVESNDLEIKIIKLIGKVSENGTLVNITDGGDGGITWVGEHHSKGKKLDEIVGTNKANILKEELSKFASERIGKKNSNFGNRGVLNPNYGKKASKETKNKIRQNTLAQFSRYSIDEINQMVKRMNDAKKNISDEIKQEWYKNISKSLKEKYESGELFSDEHRQKLKGTNYKKLNKGSDELRLSDETKQKISNKLKNRAFSLDHRNKLRKCISFEEFQVEIIKLVELDIVSSITQYRKYAKDNPELRMPQRPEKSYKNCGWPGWRKYGL